MGTEKWREGEREREREREEMMNALVQGSSINFVHVCCSQPTVAWAAPTPTPNSVYPKVLGGGTEYVTPPPTFAT